MSILSTYYYKNKSLRDIKGETWKDIPDFEGYYQVSNYGRIKSLARIVERSPKGDLPIKERILAQRVSRHLNPYTKKYHSSLFIKLTRLAIPVNLSVGRLVYFVFVEPFDLSDPTLVIIAKNGDNLQTTAKNLLLVKKTEVQRRLYKQKGKRKPVKLVSQYNSDGTLLKTYSSVIEAADETGYNVNYISQAANGHKKHCGGWLWRFGSRKKIKGIKFPYGHVRRITQYTLDGEPIETFFSITEAEKQTGFDYIGIMDTARKKRDSYKGFIWRYVD